MRISWAAALLAGTFAAAAAAQSKAPATSLERPFAAGGRITMDLSAGEYEIAGAADHRIRLDWDVEDRDRLDEVDNRVTVNGTEARVSTDGPSGNFRVRIQVPAQSSLHVRLTAGEMAIKGIEGDKDVELHAGELDIDVFVPGLRPRRAASGRVKSTRAVPHHQGRAVSIVRLEREGQVRLHAHLKAGSSGCTATAARGSSFVVRLERRTFERSNVPTAALGTATIGARQRRPCCRRGQHRLLALAGRVPRSSGIVKRSGTFERGSSPSVTATT
jgi:hypothetical protein